MYGKCRKNLGRKLKCPLCISVLVVGLVVFVQLLQLALDSQPQSSKPGTSNYFLETAEIKAMGLLIDTESCKLPDVDPFHKTTLPFIKKVKSVDCQTKYGRFTFRNKTNLFLNETAVKNLGYSIDSIFCCYSVILRVEQSIGNYDVDADSKYGLSECQRIQNKITRITAEFIKVSCYEKRLNLFNHLLYKNYHTFPQPLKNDVVRSKIKFWKKYNKHSKNIDIDIGRGKRKKIVRRQKQRPRKRQPPNILIVGIDSVSRLNFHRNLQKTVSYLKEIRSIEMLGYTKVAENTFPNTVPLLSGYSVSELEEICWNSSETPLDSCPFLWKKFSSANYLTGFLEDSPIMSIFNYYKTGFVQQPVDFYLRPFMLPLYEEKNFIQFGSFQKYTKPCLGSDQPHQKIFDYFESLLKMSQEENTPIFLYSWATGLSHDDMNQLQNADGYLENFLKGMDLNNSVLFVMSDHGFRFGQFRQTPSGWFEDKLPWLSIYLPPEIKREYPNWLEALEINSKRLLSPYDLYHTWSHLLEEFTSVSPFPEMTSNKNGIVHTLPRKFGQSIFKIVPESRTCADGGVLQSFCACSTPIAIPLESRQLKKAAEFLVVSINEKLPVQCAQLRLKSITNGAVLGSTNPNTNNGTSQQQYIVGFTVTPGDFRFEATVSFPVSTTAKNEQRQSKSSGNGEESLKILGDILRVSKYQRDVSCVSDSRMQGFCYCL